MTLIVCEIFFINIIILSLSSNFASSMNLPDIPTVKSETSELLLNNLTDPNKEMYVIHAMVYQVGIITNKTDNETNNSGVVGNQEALTFYHTNGSGIDLSGIPEPLLTNVTAQSMVGLAPTSTAGGETPSTALSWAELKKLASSQQAPAQLGTPLRPRNPRSMTEDHYGHYDAEEGTGDYSSEDMLPYFQRLYRRSLESDSIIEDTNNKTPIKIESGSAVVPQEASVQSLAIPPLLMLNNNFSKIPVPIPNTSVIQYAKVNTLVHQTPQKPV